MEDRNAPVSLWAFDMPTSLLPVKPVPSTAEPVRGFNAVADFARPSLRQLAASTPSQGRTLAGKEALPPAGGPRETFAPLSAEPALAPTLPMSHVTPPSLGIISAAVGFGTLTATAAFESRSLGWSMGFVGENNAARWLDPFVSRQVDVGPLRNPRAFSESSSDFVEQFVDWNADNDNGSEVTDYIPAVRDYQVGFTPDENDVVPLTLVEVPPITYADIVEHVHWRLQVSYSGTGRLRFWETPDKQNELTPSDDWQFTPHNIPWLQGQGRVPNVYIEGMEMSSAVGDITVTFATLTSYVGMNEPVFREFKQVKVAVTPIVKEFSVTNFVVPYFSNANRDPVPDSRGGEVRGKIEFVVEFVKPTNGRVHFFQNLMDVSHDLGLPFPAAFADYFGGLFKIAPLPAADQPVQEWRGRPANFAFPFLDQPDLNQEPWYPDHDLEVLSFPQRLLRMRMTDSPNLPIFPSASLMHFAYIFQTWVGWLLPAERAQPSPVVVAMKRIDWSMEFYFHGYDLILNAMTVNESDGRFDSTSRQVDPGDIDTLIPNIANLAVKPIRIV